MIDFLILYEVPVREFESIAMLGMELRRRGYSVEYLGFSQVNLEYYINNQKLIKKYFNNVNVVLTPSLYHDKELFSILYYVCGKCRQVVNLRWEQCFSNAVMKDPSNYLYPHESAKDAYHLCWGRRSYESLRAVDVPHENLLEAGPLHMDFLRPEFAGYYKKAEEIYPQYDIPVDAKTVLFISSFVGANMTERQIAGGHRDFDRKYKRSKEEGFNFSKESYRLTLSWIEEFLQVNKEAYFIYRPHPSENISGKLEEMVNTYPNFKVIPDYSVKQWILICDRVTTWVSTSIVESYFAGKPCFIVRPLPYPEQDDMCVYENAHFTDSKEEFLNILNTEVQTSVSGDVMYAYYDFGDRASYLRLADMLEDVIKSERVFPWPEAKVAQFEASRTKRLLRSVLVNVYRFGLKVLLKIKNATGIKFSIGLEDRIENYAVAEKKKQYDKVNRESFGQIYQRLEETVQR